MFDRNDDQELFIDTTRRFLSSRTPLSQVRALAGTDAGFTADFWREGAELGWTSLVIPEEAGGGSVSGLGALDLLLLAFEFGRHAAPGPLGPVNTVAAALGRWGGTSQHQGPLNRLISGEATAAWVTLPDHPGETGVTARTEGGSLVLSGTRTPVEAGSESDLLLVSALLDGAVTLILVPTATPGITVSRLRGLDLTRRYATVDFDSVRVPADAIVAESDEAAAAVEWIADLAVTVQLGEMVGAMDWALETSLEWAQNRYSFGRPLASYQEIKHRFADMKMWLEASAAVAEAAAVAVATDSPDRAEKVSAAKAYVGRVAPEMMQDCVQIHGGIGVTFDHDLHIFLRRVATDVPIHGSPDHHLRRLARILESREVSCA